MKKSIKTKIIAAAFAAGSVLSFTGCDSDTDGLRETNQIVYGPPESMNFVEDIDTQDVLDTNNADDMIKEI